MKKKLTLLMLLIPILLLSMSIVTPHNTFVPQTAQAFDIPDRPSNGVLDEKHYLSQQTIDSIVAMNSEFSKTEPQTQIGFYITDTIDGRNGDVYANDIARAWEIGYSTGNDNAGVMVLFAVHDHKWFIKTTDYINAYYMTTSDINSIMRTIKPDLKANNIDEAVHKLVDKLHEKLTPKTQNEIDDIKKEHEAFKTIVGWLMLAFFVGPLFFIMLTPLILRDYGDSDHGSGSWGSDSWSGGGGFNGGGSSGDW